MKKGRGLYSSGIAVKPRRRRWNKQMVMEELRVAYQKLGRAPMAKEVPRRLLWAVLWYFKKWNDGLKAAGIPLRQRRIVKRKWNEEKVAEELRTWYKKLGRTPSKREVPTHLMGLVSYYFGSWNRGLEAGGLPIRYRQPPHESTSDLIIPEYVPLTPEMAAFLAWITETAVSKTSRRSWMMVLDSPDPQLHRLLREDCRKLGYQNRNWQKSITSQRTLVCSKKLIEKMAYFIDWERDPEKRRDYSKPSAYTWKIRSTYFGQHTRLTDANLISRLFDCEGFPTWTTHRNRKYIRVAMISVNRDGLKQIQELLSKSFSIKGNMYTMKIHHCLDCHKNRCKRCGKKGHRFAIKYKICPCCGSANIETSIHYGLFIHDKKSVDAFVKEINFGLPRKRRKLEKLYASFD